MAKANSKTDISADSVDERTIIVIKLIQKHIKLSLIICGVVLYFSALALAMMTDEEFMPARSDSLIQYSDFSVIAGVGSQVTEDALVFSAEEYESVFSAALPSAEMEDITVEFSLECPESCAGAVLYVDLVGENFDSPEQEFAVTLQAGLNQISGIISLGVNIPNEVQLRIFTLDPAQYAVTNLSVTTIVPAERPVATSIALIFTVISAVVFCYLLGNKMIQKRRL